MLVRIKRRGDDWVFAPADFFDLGPRYSVDAALSRLATAGEIRRVCRGLYEVPRAQFTAGATSPSVASRYLKDWRNISSRTLQTC
jgi:hypothetical protein